MLSTNGIKITKTAVDPEDGVNKKTLEDTIKKNMTYAWNLRKLNSIDLKESHLAPRTGSINCICMYTENNKKIKSGTVSLGIYIRGEMKANCSITKGKQASKLKKEIVFLEDDFIEVICTNSKTLKTEAEFVQIDIYMSLL